MYTGLIETAVLNRIWDKKGYQKLSFLSPVRKGKFDQKESKFFRPGLDLDYSGRAV